MRIAFLIALSDSICSIDGHVYDVVKVNEGTVDVFAEDDKDAVRIANKLNGDVRVESDGVEVFHSVRIPKSIFTTVYEADYYEDLPKEAQDLADGIWN